MDPLHCIDLVEGKTLAYSPKDLDNLTKPEGCALELVPDKIMQIDDQASDQEALDDFDERPVDKTSLLNRMWREYISITLNANRDPTKPGEEAEQLRSSPILSGATRPHSDTPSGFLSQAYIDHIHKTYDGSKSFQHMLSEGSFEELADGLVLKRRVNPGIAGAVQEDSMVVYNGSFWIDGATEPYDCSWTRRSAFISDLSMDSLLPGVRALLLSMNKREWCQAFIRPEAAFGRLGVMPRIPPNATIFCLIEVMDVIPKDKAMLCMPGSEGAKSGGLTFRDFYEAADLARKRGNYFYDAKQYRPALRRYKSGIRILETLTFKDGDEEKMGHDLLVKLYNNSARASNANNEPRMALAACKQASLIDFRNPKTHWNRIVAWRKKGHLDHALREARRAAATCLEPKINAVFEREVSSLKKLIRQKEAESDDLAKKMGRFLVGDTPADEVARGATAACPRVVAPAS